MIARDDGRCTTRKACMNVNTERVQHAFDAAIGGDVEPLVALMGPDVEWRGIERGHLWWRKAPS
jgi:ketosteroid isomerase-like protein